MSEEFDDVHAGKGGSYLIGEDGKRVLQERTGQPEPDAAQPPTQPKPKVKGEQNA